MSETEIYSLWKFQFSKKKLTFSFIQQFIFSEYFFKKCMSIAKTISGNRYSFERIALRVPGESQVLPPVKNIIPNRGELAWAWNREHSWFRSTFHCLEWNFDFDFVSYCSSILRGYELWCSIEPDSKNSAASQNIRRMMKFSNLHEIRYEDFWIGKFIFEKPLVKNISRANNS